jgi:polysaccharide pyruvyl transferase WcaK-like protein
MPSHYEITLRYHAILSRLRRRILKHYDPAVLILPPAPPGSLGDEAMLLATISVLRDYGVQKIGILTYDISNNYISIPKVSFYQLRDYLRYNIREGLLRFISHTQEYTHLYLIGADVMDGYYSRSETLKKIELARVSALCGLKVVLLGFSFNSDPDELCINALKNLPTRVHIFIRDPVSYRRLTKYLVDRNISLSADVAFLLEPNITRAEVINYINHLTQLKYRGYNLIGVNLSYLILGKEPKQVEVNSLISLISDILLKIATLYANTVFVFVPHDLRGPMNDYILSKMLADKLKNKQVLLIPESFNSQEIKSICGQLDVAFTCRMHMGIACLSQSIPIAAIGYQGKFEGLMELFGLEKLLLDSTCLNQNNLLNIFLYLIENQEKLKSTIQRKLPEVKLLAKKNFIL